MMKGNILFNRRIHQRLRQLSISTLGSVKIKLLLFSCVAFGLFFVAKRAASGMGWRHRHTLPESSRHLGFKEIKDLKTDALFSIDDDVIFPCTSVEFAFSVWRSAPATMVGFVPRMHWLDKSQRDNIEQYKYGGWWSVWWMGTYSMVLSKAAFFHRKYLPLYTNNMSESIRGYVTKNRNCEDIAMSFLVAKQTDAPPIWVKELLVRVLFITKWQSTL